MKSLNLNFPASSGVLINTGGCLVVHASRETSGSASAVYRLWDSDTNEGQLLLPVSLVANQSTRDDFLAHHLTFKTGLYYEKVSGALEGAVAVLVHHECDHLWPLIVDLSALESH